MINTRFEAYKLKRELQRSGKQFELRRSLLNEFGEPECESETVGFATGIYHEQNSNIQITTGDTTQIRTKKIPMILLAHDDVAKLEIKTGDFVMINGRKFNVVGIVNVQEWNIVADMSLELVDDVTED